ncbi:MAG: TIGR02186 family protein [Acidobacteriota bacterium]
MKRARTASLVALAVLSFALSGFSQEPAAPTARISPEVIRMDAFYGGAQIRVEGEVPAGSGVYLVVKGPQIEESFNKKGRFGPIWANAGKVRIAGVPALFIGFSSAPLADLLSREALEAGQLDVTSIQAQMKVDPPVMDQPLVRENYLKLKSDQGILQVNEGTVAVTPGENSSRYAVSFAWPKVAPPADYRLEVYACRDGRVLSRAELPLKVLKVGFPEKMAGMAKDRAVLYGILCILVATLAGLGIDFIASRLGGKVSAH